MNKQIFEACRKHFAKNLWQSSIWEKFQKELGKQTFFFGEDEAVGMGIIQPLPFNLSFLELPRGPLGMSDEQFWAEVESTAKKHNCLFTRISPEHRAQALPKWNFISDAQVHPTDTLILDLTLSEEELLKQMKPKGRYNIRVAQRKKVKVFESTDINAYYALLEETTSRDGFSGHPKSYYETMLKSLGENAKMYLASMVDAEENEVIIAGGIFTYLDDTCTYYYGASSNKHRDAMAPYLIQWTAIADAQKQGYKKYDFLGIAPKGENNHALAGVTRFKKQFGGEHITYPLAKDIVHKLPLYLAYRAYKLIRKFW